MKKKYGLDENVLCEDKNLCKKNFFSVNALGGVGPRRLKCPLDLNAECFVFHKLLSLSCPTKKP